MERSPSLLVRQYQEKNDGFTLPEILVVIFIITVLGGITFANYHQGGKEMALQRSAYKLAQDIRRVQEMAIGAKECVPCGNTIPPRYGLYLPEPGSAYYVIFADLNLPKGDGMYTPPPDKLIETINFENGVSYLDVSGIGCSGAFPAPGLRRIHLTFSPPDPTTEIKVGWGASIISCSEISVTLSFGGTGGLTRLVKINRVGMIEIK